jgi:hypothetical protein
MYATCPRRTSAFCEGGLTVEWSDYAASWELCAALSSDARGRSTKYGGKYCDIKKCEATPQVPREASFESCGGDENRRKNYVYLDVEEPITCRTMDKGSMERSG